MAHHPLRLSRTPPPLRSHSPTTPQPPPAPLDVPSPFGHIDGLDRDDYQEAAYEVFFTSCRSSPGFGGRSVITYYNNLDEEGPGLPRAAGVGMAVTSRVKRALGLKMLRRSTPRRSSSCGSNPSSPGAAGSPRATATATVKRCPMTSAEIMRQQMWVTEQSDNRLD